jgi:hypothetical protein
VIGLASAGLECHYPSVSNIQNRTKKLLVSAAVEYLT